MKGIKLSKISWLILSAGVFVVILAGLGVTRSQQAREQSRMNAELIQSEASLNKINVTDLRRQLEELNQRVESGQVQLEEARHRLEQTVVSVDVTDELFKIADYSGVVVMNLSTTAINSYKLEGIGLKTISLSAQAEGELENIIDFVINLNNGYTTGYVESAQIAIPIPETDSTAGEEGGEASLKPAEDQPSVAVQMIVYSYEGD